MCIFFCCLLLDLIALTRVAAGCYTEQYWASSQGGRGAQNLRRGPVHLLPAAVLAKGSLPILLLGQKVSFTRVCVCVCVCVCSQAQLHMYMYYINTVRHDGRGVVWAWPVVTSKLLASFLSHIKENLC